MSVKTTLIKNTGFNLAGYAYLLFASFFSISILLAALGRDYFGVYLFLASFVPLASVFDFGISTAVVRKLSIAQTSEEDRVSTWKTSFFIFLFLGAVLFVISFALLKYLTVTLPIFSGIDEATLSWTVLILSLIIFVNHINTHFLTLPQAEHRFDIFNSKTLLVGTANTILSAIIAGFFPNIAIIFLVQLAFHLLTFIFLVFYSFPKFPGKSFLPKYDKQSGKDMISFGLKNFIGTLASQFEAQFGKFVLGSMVSAGAVTAYSIPQNVVAKGAGVVSQISQVVFPISASLLEKNRVRKLKTTIIWLQLIILLGGLLAIFLSFTIGEEFLQWWLNDSVVVAQAYPVLKILSIYFVLTALTPIPTVVMQSINRPQIPSFFAVFTVITEVIAILTLTPMYQVLGVAYAVLIASIITVPPFLIVAWILFNREIVKIES